MNISTKTKQILRSHFDVNGFDENWLISLQKTLHSPKAPGCSLLFKTDLANMILRNAISPKEYEELTGEDFDSPEDFNQWLRSVWYDDTFQCNCNGKFCLGRQLI